MSYSAGTVRHLSARSYVDSDCDRGSCCDHWIGYLFIESDHAWKDPKRWIVSDCINLAETVDDVTDGFWLMPGDNICARYAAVLVRILACAKTEPVKRLVE